MSNFSNKFTATIDILEPPIKVITLYPDKDAPLLQEEPYVNYGDAALMQCTNSDKTRAAAIMHFSGIQKVDQKVWDNLAGIDLHLEVSGHRTHDYTINASTYNSNLWEEEFVSWGNAPKKGNKLFEFDVKPDKDSYDIDIAYLIKSRNAKKYDDIGFYFNSFAEAEKRIVSICSKESGRKPCIRIKYYDIPGAPYAKNLPGSVNVKGLVFNKSNPYELNGRTQAQISGSFDIKPIYEYKEIKGEVTVPKFVAIHEVYTDNKGKVIGENAKDGEMTPSTKQYIPTDEDLEKLIADVDWGVEIKGNVAASKKVPARVITGSVTPWYGSAFEFKFYDVANKLKYSGVERKNILANMQEFSRNQKNFSKILSEGDMITGSVTNTGVVRDFIYGEITVCIPVEEKLLPVIDGTVTTSQPVFETTDVDDHTICGGDLLVCPNKIVYKKDDEGNDTEVIDEEKSEYFKVDGCVGNDKFHITGEITISKFFATESKYYSEIEDTEPVFIEKIDTDATDLNNLLDESKVQAKKADYSVEVVCPKANIVFTKDGETDNLYKVDETATGNYLYILGEKQAELDGNVTIIYEIDDKEKPSIDGSIDVASMVFKTTIDEGNNSTSTGDLITGTVDTLATMVKTIEGNVSAAVLTNYDFNGSITVSNPIDESAIPTITCDSSNIVYIKDANGKDTTVVDDSKSGPYLLIKAKVYPTDDKPEKTLCGGDLLTGTIRVSRKSAFKYTFTKTDGETKTVDFSDEIEDLYNDANGDHRDEYTSVESTGDLLKGTVNSYGLVHKYTIDENDNVTHEGDLLVCHSDKITYEKDEKGHDTIYIDEKNSEDYFRVMAICGAINAYDIDGKRVKDLDIYEENPNIDFVKFDKPNQEISGDTFIAAKETAWLNGTINAVSVIDTEIDGTIGVQGGVFAEVRGSFYVDGDMNLSYGFII